MDFDPRLDAPQPSGLQAKAQQWMRDYAVLATKITGRAPSPDFKVNVVTLEEMGPIMAGISQSVVKPEPTSDVLKVGNVGSGIVMDFLAKKFSRAMASGVMGLYVPKYQAGGGEPALYIVEENLRPVAEKLGVDPEALAHYVALHEATHQWQFTANPWLNDYMKQRIDAVVGGMASVGELRKQKAWLLLIPKLLSAGPEMQELQAQMSLIEGYADFLTQSLNIDSDPKLAAVSKAYNARRESPSTEKKPAGQKFLESITMVNLKQNQYLKGRQFCEAVHAAGGHELLNHVWDSPETLPNANEMANPALWVARMRGGLGKAA